MSVTKTWRKKVHIYFCFKKTYWCDLLHRRRVVLKCFWLYWMVPCFVNLNFFFFFLSRCVHITDIGVGYISTMLSLTALFMRWCTQIRDFGLQHLCSMRNLQVLSLAGCPQLTSSGLSSLIQLRHLQELELTNCPGSSQELFEYLREHLPRCLIIE